MKNRFLNQTICFDGKSPHQTIKLKKLLGFGAFAEVYSTDSIDYVVKVINMANPKVLASYHNEKYVYTMTEKHQNLVFCYNFKEDEKYTYFLLENCAHGSLFQLISAYQDKTLPESMILQILSEITTALHKLHSSTPPIIHRDIKIENILIGIDGNLKLCDFGSITTKKYSIVNEKNRANILEDIENNTTPNYRSPEQSDLYLGYEINEKVDIWALGCVLFMLCFQKFAFESKLAVLNNNLIIPKNPQYSEKITSLFQKIFVLNPNDRPSALDLLTYLQGCEIKEKIANNKQIMTNLNKSPKHVKPNFFALVNKHFKRLTTKSEGWLLSAIEQNEEGPKQKYVRFLIIKAWQKKTKIEKFYKFLIKNKQKNIENTVVIMKILILLHNYLKKGPTDVFHQPNEKTVLSIVKEISTHWKEICERQNFYNKDQIRNSYFSHIIYKYSLVLQEKIKLHLENLEVFEGNFSIAPLLKQKPKNQKFFHSAFIDKLLKYLKSLSELNSLFLQDNSLWKIQSSMIFSMIDEEYCLICLLTHLIFAFQKLTNYTSEAKTINKDSIPLIRLKFNEMYKKINEFFNRVKSMKEFSEIIKLIPNLNLNVLNFLEKQEIFQDSITIPFDLVNDLNYNHKILDLTIPLSYGLSVQINVKDKKNPSKKEEMQIRPMATETMMSANEKNNKKYEFSENKKFSSFGKIPKTKLNEENELENSSPNPKIENNKQNPNCQDYFDFDFNNFKQNNSEYFAFNSSSKPQNVNFIEDDQIYKEFSHQDFNQFLFPEKNMIDLDKINNNPGASSNKNQINDAFNNFPNNFQNSENMMDNNLNNIFKNDGNFNNNNNNIPQPSNENVGYVDFFNNEIANAPLNKENALDYTNFFNNEVENAFSDFKNEFAPKKEVLNSVEKTKKETKKISESELITLELTPLSSFGDMKPISSQMKEFLKDNVSKDIEEWFIDYKNLTFEKIIGTGSSSEVFLGKWNTKDVAIKKVKVVLSNTNSFQEFQREISTLMKLKPHQNLLALLGISYNEFEVFIITEFCFGGNLFELLHRKTEIKLEWKLRVKFIKDIARGIEYLHNYDPPLIHRDLKSLNLLIDQEELNQANIKIADFGLSRIFQTTDIGKMTGITGTFHWMAPEIFENKPYSLKADVYSFGIILWEICSRETPYKDLKGPHAIMKYVTIDQRRPELSKIEEECPCEIINIMKQCWNHDPNLRPNISDVVIILNSL